jgi:hypothetical protein
MYEQVEKPKANKSRAVANSVAQKKSNVRQGFGFVDNRPEAIMQKKLQEVAIKSTQAIPSMLFQKMTDVTSQTNKVNLLKGKDVFQRVVDRANATESSTGDYIIPNDDKKILYSKTTATNPVPASLYIQGNDVTSDLVPINLNSWTPNVRLFSDMERGQAQTNRTQEVPSDAFCGLAAHFGSTMQVPQHDLEDGMIDGLMANITGLPNAPTTGLLGKNDCGEFADQLQNLIGAGNDRPALPAHRGPLETQVGDKMKHTLTDPDDCPYHYSTIVAADGVSKVTLEANAGESLSAPEFFIRGGIRGFMRDNNEDYDNGTDHTITRLSSKTTLENRQALDTHKLDQPAYRTTGGRKITDTVSEM